MEYFNSLPLEIILDIITRLPIESVLECKLVSTTWRCLIRHPSFSKMHLHHINHPAADSGMMTFIALTSFDGSKVNFQYIEYSENHESIKIKRTVNFNTPCFWCPKLLGSCNGLICYLAERIYIFNPIVREYIMLPEIKRVKMVRIASGFGYVSSTREYKVVTVMLEFDSKLIEVFIYTLGSGNGWRNLGELNFGSEGHWNEGVFVNGALYWWDSLLNMIIAFDLCEEKFCGHLSPPPLSNSGYVAYCKLEVLDGCLSFAVNKSVNGAKCWDVSLLKKKDDNHGMKEQEGHQSLGWSKVFRVYDSELFAITKNCTVLTFNDRHVNIHDLEASTSKTIVDFKELFGGVFPHKNTLVSLKQLGEDAKIME